MYTMQELHLFLLLSIISTSLSMVLLHSPTNLLTNLFYMYSFSNLNTHQNGMTYHIHTHSQLPQLPSISFITYTFIN